MRGWVNAPVNAMWTLLLAVLCTALPLGTAMAQTVPDAGSVLRQTERELAPPLPPALPAPAPPPAATTATGETTVEVRRFIFAGNRLLSDEQLAETVAPWLDRPLRLTDLQAAAAAVAARYRAEGWLARAVLPRQEVADGTVEIRIVEAIFGQVRLQRPAATSSPSSEPPIGSRVDVDVLTARVLARQRSGEPLRLPALERGLLLGNDLPGAGVSGSLVTGLDDGTTDLLLSTVDKPALGGEVSADNEGARGTGSERVNARVVLASPLGLGDEVNAQLQAASGILFGRIAASLPVGSDGLRAGASVSGLRYRVRGDTFRAIEPSGSAGGASLDLSYPLLRAHDHNLYLVANGEHKRFDNRTLLATTSHYGVDSATLRLYGNRYDTLGLGGVTSASVGVTRGRVKLDGSPNQQADAATAATGGSYGVVRYSLSRQQTLGERLDLFIGASGQVASKNLDSSERFSLGGPGGVRAYPVNEGTGSEGQLVNVEARWRPPVDCRCSVSAFYDWGHVKVNHDASFAGAPTLNGYALKGYGVGVSVALPAGFQLQAQLAMRQGRNPNATPTGQDQDGSLHKPRVWLSIGRSFG